MSPSGLHFAHCHITATTVANTAVTPTSPEGLPSVTPVLQPPMAILSQLPVSHLFPSPSLSSASLQSFPSTSCPSCLDGAWAPLVTPHPQFFQAELFPIPPQVLRAESEFPSSATLFQTSSHSLPRTLAI